MTEFVKVAAVGDIPDGGRIWVEFDEETVLVLRVGDDYYCIADYCTHDEESLEDGPLDGHCIECPRHGALFDIRTGEATRLPATSPVPTFAVKVEENAIWVESPDG